MTSVLTVPTIPQTTTEVPPDLSPLLMENVYHTPGQAAAIRFFDENSQDDLDAMRDILSGKQVKKWMDNTAQISRSDYQDWARTTPKSSYLFAIVDARLTDPEQASRVRGFIYLYSEREEKFRVKRMEKLGFIPPASRERHLLEVSFAARPLRDGEQSGSGLISSALRQSCLQLQMLLNSPSNPEVDLFAFVDPRNLPAQRTLEAAGFIKKGQMKYDWNSYEDTLLFILDWRVLQQKLRDKLLEVLRNEGHREGQTLP